MDNFKFVVMLYPKSGDYFIKALIEANLFPSMVVTNDPFYVQEKDFLSYARKIKRWIFRSKSEIEKNFLPYKLAKENNIPVWPAQKVNTQEFQERLKSINPDYIFVFTFKILKEFIFSIPKKGTINFHPALLPKHRGAQPIFWTLKNGDREAGFTFHFIDKGIDTGKIIEQYKIPISGSEDSTILQETLHYLGSVSFIKLITKLKFGHDPGSIEQTAKESYEKLPKTEDKTVTTDNTLEEIDRILRASKNYGYAVIKSGDITFKATDFIDITDLKFDIPEPEKKFEFLTKDGKRIFFLTPVVLKN